MTVTLADIERVVREWHNRHPLARRVRGEAVHSIGWVGLPYMRASQAVDPSLDGPSAASAPPRPAQPFWKRWRRSNGGAGPWPVFSEAFIEGLTPKRIHAFAGQCAWVHALEGTDDWPLRRIAVDERLAEGCHGAWPTERWLITAAIESKGQKLRVLIGEAQGRLQVLGGHRHWDRLKLLALGGLIAAAGALALAAVLDRPEPPAPAGVRPAPPQTRASGTMTAPASSAASLPASAASAPTEGPDPVTGTVNPSPAAASAAAAPAASQAVAHRHSAAPTPASAPSAPATTASPPDEGRSSEPVPDIRPQLGPVRKVRPPKPGASAPRSPQAVVEGKGAPPAAATTASAPVAQPGARKASPVASPERIRPATVPEGPMVALVSPGFTKRADAEAQLALMQAHLKATVREGSLQGEVFESPQGWRAAVWPFGSRAEAQIVNATMVARGWKTRAVDF